MSTNKIEKIFKKYIKKSAFEALVINIKVTAGVLPTLVMEIMGITEPKIYITTRALKHLYDRKPAEEFNFILDNFARIIAQPDELYKNKADKRGQFCLVKQISGQGYFISLEITEGEYKKKAQIVTAFRVRSEPYLNEYDLLWSRRDGATHSS